MAGIYIHIPYCRTACHYCDFHFSTKLISVDSMVNSILMELKNRAVEFRDERVETIYFGGGTPSVLNLESVQRILQTIERYYAVQTLIEVTFEMNPEDVSLNYLEGLKKVGINRISLGLQSLYDEDLKMMNRKHSASESLEAIEAVKKYFSNFSIDLIYGLPHLTVEKWEASIEKILSYEPPHISAYALTVEPQTAWDYFVQKKQYPPIDDKLASQHFYKLSDRLKKSNYQHYEISNFSLPNYESKHNTSYWNGLPYIGVGPSAHSYNGSKRRWNISKNPLYIKKINEGIQYYEEETLTKNDRFNELIMTGLRTLSGVSLAELKSEVGDQIFSKFLIQVSETEGLYIEDNRLKLQPSFWFLSDGIAANLFCV